MAINPRWKTGKRRIYQARFRAEQPPCAICGKPINWQAKTPAWDAFVIDEKIPISKWREAGYASPSACADDIDNIRATHYICNARKGNKINYNPQAREKTTQRKSIEIDGKW